MKSRALSQQNRCNRGVRSDYIGAGVCAALFASYNAIYPYTFGPQYASILRYTAFVASLVAFVFLQAANDADKPGGGLQKWQTRCVTGSLILTQLTTNFMRGSAQAEKNLFASPVTYLPCVLLLVVLFSLYRKPPVE